MRARPWRGFRSLLCAVDFSEHSRLALRYAAALASRRDTALTVLYANDPLLVAAASVALHDRTVARRSAKELRQFIHETLHDASLPGVRVKSRVCVGTADDEIVKAAVARRTDLIVMGTHGLTGADRWLMGSTTLSVLQRTPVPVLAIPSGIGDLSPVLSSWPDGRIVAALELDRESRKDVETAARIAGWLGASLLLVHVIDSIDAPSWLEGALSAHDRIRTSKAQRELDACAAIARRRVDTQTRVLFGKPADEIAAVVADETSGLLITALHDRRAWFGARRGSVSYHVLSHAVVPVLAWPPSWQPR
jgi:nucleotide-binding universal stress UspA family protein